MKSGKDGDGVVREKASDRLKRLMQQNNEKIQQAQAMRLQHSEFSISKNDFFFEIVLEPNY